MFRIIFFILSLFTFEVWGDTIVENFNSSPERRWDFFTDQVMGGRSTGKLEFISSGETNYARLSGNVTTENNGGFIQFRAFLQNTLNSKIEGIKLANQIGADSYMECTALTQEGLLPIFKKTFDLLIQIRSI